jgi:hypothetical protein
MSAMVASTRHAPTSGSAARTPPPRRIALATALREGTPTESLLKADERILKQVFTGKLKRWADQVCGTVCRSSLVLAEVAKLWTPARTATAAQQCAGRLARWERRRASRARVCPRGAGEARGGGAGGRAGAARARRRAPAARLWILPDLCCSVRGRSALWPHGGSGKRAGPPRGSAHGVSGRPPECGRTRVRTCNAAPNPFGGDFVRRTRTATRDAQAKVHRSRWARTAVLRWRWRSRISKPLRHQMGRWREAPTLSQTACRARSRGHSRAKSTTLRVGTRRMGMPGGGCLGS